MSDLDNFFGDDNEKDVWSDTANNDWVNEDADDTKEQDIWSDATSNVDEVWGNQEQSDVEDNSWGNESSNQEQSDVEDNSWDNNEQPDVEDNSWDNKEQPDVEENTWGNDSSNQDQEDNTWGNDSSNQEQQKEYNPWEDDEFKDSGTNNGPSKEDAYNPWEDDEFKDSSTQDNKGYNPWEDDEFGGSNTSNNNDNSWGNEELDLGLNQEEKPRKEFNFNYKQVSLIVAGACVVLALLLFGLSKIHITVNTGQQNSVNKEASSVESNATGSKNLQYVPNTTNINYDSNVVETTGKITKKEKYLLGNQLIYDAVIEVPAGTEKLSLHYYCSKDVFDSLYESTSVTVYYQVASDNYFSIKSVKAQ